MTLHSALVLALSLSLVPTASAAGRHDEDLPAEARAWLEKAAQPLDTLDPGWESADLVPLGERVGDSRMVLVGEATHGSREFFRFKHRLFEFLVREHGFTDFVMESDWVAAHATQAWIAGGEGDVDAALRGLSSLWATDEYRDLLQWMRSWNADPAHATKVRLHGMDMQEPGPAAIRHVTGYLERVDGDLAADIGPMIESIGNRTRVEEADLEGVLSLFDDMREPFTEASSASEWAVARQHLVVLIQRYRQGLLRGDAGTSWRDECMARNALWILEQFGGRMIVSAHNGHVSRSGLFDTPTGPVQSIGRALSASPSGPRPLILGTAFGKGGFWAYGAAGGGLQPFRVEAPLAGSIEAALTSAGLERPSVIDLRTLPATGPAHDAFARKRPAAMIGGAWDPAWYGDPNRDLSTAVTEQYDLLLFVPEVTAAVRS